MRILAALVIHPAKLAEVLRTAIGPASLAGQLAVRSTAQR